MNQAQVYEDTILDNVPARVLCGVRPMRIPAPHDKLWGSRATRANTRKPGLNRWKRLVSFLRYPTISDLYIIRDWLSGALTNRVVMIKYKAYTADVDMAVTNADGVAWLRPVQALWAQHARSEGGNTHPAVLAALKITQPRNWRVLLLQYPRISTEVDGMLVYNSCYDKLARAQYTRTSPGKYLREHFPTLTDVEIRDIIALTCAKGEFSISFTMAGILDGIEDGPRSCMKGFDRATHPYRVYDPDHGWGMATRTSTAYECSSCRAPRFFSRALVNRNNMSFVRSYKYGGTPDTYSNACEQLEAWLQSQGYRKRSSWEDARVARIEAPDHNDALVMPYIDGSEQTVYEGAVDYLTLTRTEQTPNRFGEANATVGFLRAGNAEDDDEDMWTCSHCGEDYPEGDDRYWIGVNEEEPICSYCRENSYVSAHGRRGHEYLVHEDDARYCEDDGEYYVEGHFSSNGVVECHDTGDLRKLDNTFQCAYDDEYYGDDCDHITMPDGECVFRDNVEDYFRDDWNRFIEWWADQASDYCTPTSDWAQLFIDACEDGDLDLETDDDWAVYAACCERVKHEPTLKRDDEEDDEETNETEGE